jgi:periplasmic copper chaperone A
MRLILYFVLAFNITACQADEIIITNAWIAQSPPMIDINAGYFKIENRSTMPVSLLAISSPAFGEIEIHRSLEEGQLSKMQYIESIDILPGEKYDFSPGSYHLMLFDPVRILQSGDNVPLQFSFTEAVQIQVIATVKSRSN